MRSIKEDVWIPTVCRMCQNCCSILAHRVDGVIVKLEGNPKSPHNDGKMCAKGHSGLMSLYDPNRVSTPLKRTNHQKGIGIDPKWIEISWEEAMNCIAEKLEKIRTEDPRKLLVWNFDPQASPVLAGGFCAAYGTPNFTHGTADFFCGNGYHNPVLFTHGTFFAEPDFEYTDYCLLIGSQNGFNIGTNPMGLARRMADARARGMKIVVVDPVCSQAAGRADEWVPIRPGTDAAFSLGIINVLLNDLQIYDSEFLKKYTNGPYLIGKDGKYIRSSNGKPLVWDLGENAAKEFSDKTVTDFALEGEYLSGGKKCKPSFQLLKEHVKNYTLKKVSQITSIPAETIRRIANEFGQAARIGSTIKIHGQEFPHRGAVVNWNRGAIAHKHGELAGLAIQLLNMVIGAIGVPGGDLGVNVIGPLNTWRPAPDEDGLLVPPPELVWHASPYPPRKVIEPETFLLEELYPVSLYTAMIPFALLEPDKYKLPYRIEFMYHCSNNYLVTAANPDKMAEAFSKIDFIVSSAFVIDESVEMADIVLPEPHYLETFTPFPNLEIEWMLCGEVDWYWMLRQPVVQPPPGVKTWVEVLIELANRLNMREEYYIVLNTFYNLKEPHKLNPNKKYTVEEITDKIARSKFGDDIGVEYLKENGLFIKPKPLEAAYPRIFLEARIPIYFEFHLQAREEVIKVTNKLGIDWDVSDYEPLIDWKPCPSHQEENSEYDLWVVNSKVPFHTHSFTQQNPWLAELSEGYPGTRAITIHPETAKRKGLKDGDMVWLVSHVGKIKGTILITEGVHPEVLGTVAAQGLWAKGRPIAKGKGVHFNRLIAYDYNHLDYLASTIDSCMKVKIFKA